MNNKNVHVVPDTKNGLKWKVKSENKQKAVAITENKEDAIKIAKQIAKNRNSEFFEHGKDGKF